jgi:hypothetical protein
MAELDKGKGNERMADGVSRSSLLVRSEVVQHVAKAFMIKDELALVL